MGDEDEEDSYQASSESSADQRIKEDPWDIRPEFSENAPVDTTSFCLENDEEMKFYQRSRYPIHCCLAHTESEVVITSRRVIITQADTLRGRGQGVLPIRMRQHVLDRSKVAGYEAGAVQPRCCHLIIGLILLVASLFFLIGGENSIWLGLRMLNPMVYVRFFGGKHCRHLGVCGIEAPLKVETSSLVQLSTPMPSGMSSLLQADVHTSAAKASPSPGATFLELRPSGHLLAKRDLLAKRARTESSSFPSLAPTRSKSPGVESSLVEEPSLAGASQSQLQLSSVAGAQLGRSQPDDPTDKSPPPEKENSKAETASKIPIRRHPTVELSPPKCKDFPSWVDSDGAECERYENNRWALSCVGYGAGAGTAPEQSERFDARRDSTALHLSALEACCVCGGGENVAKTMGIKRLVDSLWPVVMALSGSSESTGFSAGHISAAGKAVLQEAFHDMKTEQLIKNAKIIAAIRTGELVAGVLEPSTDIKTLLWELQHEQRILQVGQGMDSQPLPGLTMYALNLDMKDSEAQSRNQGWMDFYATLAYVQPFLICILRALNLVVLVVSCGMLGKWWSDQRSMDRIYVTLKVNKDYFGPEKDVQGTGRPFDKTNHKVEQLLGFYLPPSRSHPYRLREMSNALMGSGDGGGGNSFGTRNMGPKSSIFTNPNARFDGMRSEYGRPSLHGSENEVIANG